MENPLPVPTLIYNLGQNKMEQKTPIPPQIKDEAARRAKNRAIFPSLIWGGGRGGLGFPFILSKIVAEVPTPDGFLRSEHQNGRHRNVIYESFSSWFCLPLCDLIKATRSCY